MCLHVSALSSRSPACVCFKGFFDNLTPSPLSFPLLAMCHNTGWNVCEYVPQLPEILSEVELMPFAQTEAPTHFCDSCFVKKKRPPPQMSGYISS